MTARWWWRNNETIDDEEDGGSNDLDDSDGDTGTEGLTLPLPSVNNQLPIQVEYFTHHYHHDSHHDHLAPPAAPFHTRIASSCSTAVVEILSLYPAVMIRQQNSNIAKFPHYTCRSAHDLIHS